MKEKPLLRLLAAVLLAGRAFGQGLPAPPGPNHPVSATETEGLSSFHSSDRLVATYYFYWYDSDSACIEGVCDPAYTRGHIEFATGVHGAKAPVSALTNTPLNLEAMDYADPDWHASQLDLIVSASIDVILPIFWGVPGRYGEFGHHCAKWSAAGLRALGAALDKRAKEGKPSPRVGMFYDTTTLTFESPFNYEQGKKIDLRTELGKRHFYATIRDFYSLVRPAHWALWEGKPFVWLYSSNFAEGYDDTLLPDAKERFAEEFGGLEPWFVANVDWTGAGADWVYGWGAAIQPSYLSVGGVGPGFDNSGANGKARGSLVSRDRENGKFYRDAWERALRAETPVVVVETWNELHEGTEIVPTLEYGDEYSKTTGRYAARFKSGEEIPPLPGPFQGSESVSWEGGGALSKGIEPVEVEDGPFRKVVVDNEEVLETVEPYLYFAVDDSFAFADLGTLYLEVEFLDLPPSRGSLHVEYDSWDREGNFHGIYRASEEAEMTRTFRWRTHRFPLPTARLSNNQNRGADFRLVAPKGLRIRSVTLTRTPASPNEPRE